MHTEDPTRLVEETFERVRRERMDGLAILHPALRVEAVGLQPWNGQWLGVLITPWAMSVLLLPADPQAWVSMPPQQRRFVSFPFGDLAFLEGEEPGLGEYQTCSLFSPMQAFASQHDARATARASLAALLAPARPRAAAPPPASRPMPSHAAASRRRFLGMGA